MGEQISCLAQNCTILYNQLLFLHNLPPKSHTILTFFPHPVRSPVFSILGPRQHRTYHWKWLLQLLAISSVQATTVVLKYIVSIQILVKLFWNNYKGHNYSWVNVECSIPYYAKNDLNHYRKNCSWKVNYTAIILGFSYPSPEKSLLPASSNTIICMLYQAIVVSLIINLEFLIQISWIASRRAAQWGKRKKSRKPQVMNHCLIRENSDRKMLPLSLMFNILCKSYFISKLKKKIPTIFLDSFIFTFLHISAFLWSHESLKIIYQSCYIITPSMLQAIRLFCHRYMYSHFASALNISMQGMQELIFCK